MSYVVFSRRYRPQTLEQVIGQEHISRTLKNAIHENRVAHAYLFSGPRGVGKTSIARILAKGLNCKSGPTDDPCGTCDNCREIAAGTSVDVQEIDGASNRGIDEIRALRENVKFAPAVSKYKIYIIDEAHQITDAAFNALLKTLEEPPDHVVFILATTEPQKIPVTILSRCQRYRFRLLSSKEIIATLEKIVNNEGFKVEPAALQVITNAAGGSMRDALSLLDQAVSFVSGHLTHKDVEDLLGLLPKDIVRSFTEALARNDARKILGLIKEVSEQGYSLLQFGRDLRDHLRQILLVRVSPETLEATREDKEALEGQKDFFSTAWLIRSGHLISRALDEMRWSDQPRLVFELAAVKLAQPYVGVSELVERVEKLEKNIPFETERFPGEDTAPRPPAREVSEKAPGFEAAPVAPAPQQEETPVPSPAPAAAEAGQDIQRLWNEAVLEFQRQRPLVGNALSGATAQGISGGSLLVNALNRFQQDGLKRHQAAIEEIVEKKFGRNLGLRVSVSDKNPGTSPQNESAVEEIVVPEEEEAPANGKMYQVEGDLSTMGDNLPAGLEKIINKFPGRITKKKNAG